MMGSLLLMPEPGGLGDNADDENKNILMRMNEDTKIFIFHEKENRN